MIPDGVQVLVGRLQAWLFPTEHTGDQRCLPCTVVNLGLLVLSALIIALFSKPAAVSIGILGIFLIWIRGYFVPYTPQFAPKVAAHLPVHFHESTRQSSSLTELSKGGIETTREGDEVVPGTTGLHTDQDSSNDVSTTILPLLSEAGIIRQRGDTLTLDESYREKWRSIIRDVRTNNLKTAIKTTTPAANVERVTEGETTWYVLTDEDRSIKSETWLSPAIATAEVAAIKALEGSLSPSTAVQAAAVLRPFLEQCPVCDGDLVETTADQCCASYGPAGPQNVLACSDCEEYVARWE